MFYDEYANTLTFTLYEAIVIYLDPERTFLRR